MARKIRDDHNAGIYPPCPHCGTTGGGPCGGGNRPTYRPHGLCSACYRWHYSHGSDAYFPYPGRVWAERPTIPTGYLDPFMLGCTRDQHAVMPGGHELARQLFLEAEVFAAAFLASRQLGGV